RRGAGPGETGEKRAFEGRRRRGVREWVPAGRGAAGSGDARSEDDDCDTPQGQPEGPAEPGDDHPRSVADSVPGREILGDAGQGPRPRSGAHADPGTEASEKGTAAARQRAVP